MGSSILIRIIEFVSKFELEHRESPTRLYLPKLVENELGRLNSNDIDRLAGGTGTKGLRKTIIEDHQNRIYGMEVHWDAEELKVE